MFPSLFYGRLTVTGARGEGVVALVIEPLGEAAFERAAALVAREQAAARQVRPELPAGFGDATACEAALRHLFRVIEPR